MATHQSPKSLKAPGPKHVGFDLTAHNIVNHALEVRENLGTMCAIEYLKSNNVDSAQIRRVLKSLHS